MATVYLIQIFGKMKQNDGGTDSSFRPSFGGEPVYWDTDDPDCRCDCPGPPPHFYLPPPPRPPSLVDSHCLKNSVPHLGACEIVPVIDAEYHYSPAITSLAIILTIGVIIVVFLLIGTTLVALKKKKIQDFFLRKSSSQNDTALTNGVFYGDLINVRHRKLSPHCPPGQTTLSSIEMIDVISYPDRTMFSPIFICSKSSAPDSYRCQELFNPVYEELSNESEERCETDSEGMPQAAVSEDEFAEDELSLGEEKESRHKHGSQQKKGSTQESSGNDVSKDVDFSDADDKSKFLENIEGNANSPLDLWTKEKKTSCGTVKRPKNFDRKKLLRSKGLPLSASPNNCSEFHEGFLVKKFLQVYPDFSKGSSQSSCDRVSVPCDYSLGYGRCESLAIFSQTSSCHLKPDVFSTFEAMQNSSKNYSQDSSLGSDSGYSYDTSGGMSSSKAQKDYRLPSRSDPVLS